eukprot:3491905-Amphidinium_carterae.1
MSLERSSSTIVRSVSTRRESKQVSLCTPRKMAIVSQDNVQLSSKDQRKGINKEKLQQDATSV